MLRTHLRLILFFISMLLLAALACNAVAPQTNPVSPSATLPPELVQAAVATVQAELQTAAPAGSEQSPTIILENDTLAPAVNMEETLVTLYKRVNPAVVHIVSPLGSGSGFVFDSDGHIVTNYHVVVDTTEFEVIFSNSERRTAAVIGSDIDSDLAVIAVEDLPEGISPIELGDSNEIEVGQFVATIGNPFGEQGSMSLGIISGLGRSLASQRLGYSLPQVIQTDAPINPGNSGGPLLDLEGRLLGVNTAIRTTTGVSSGVGFAIPVNAVRRIVPTLIATGVYIYPYMGIEVPGQPLSLADYEALGLPQTSGAYVTGVRPESPAAEAGLIGQQGPGGDLIIAVDGRPVLEFNDLLSYLVFETTVGQTIELTILRNGQEMIIPLTLGERP